MMQFFQVPEKGQLHVMNNSKNLIIRRWSFSLQAHLVRNNCNALFYRSDENAEAKEKIAIF